MSRLTEIFAFSEAFPLIFTQAAFWIFLAVVYLFFVLVYRNIRIRTTYLFFCFSLFLLQDIWSFCIAFIVYHPFKLLAWKGYLL